MKGNQGSRGGESQRRVVKEVEREELGRRGGFVGPRASGGVNGCEEVMLVGRSACRVVDAKRRWSFAAHSGFLLPARALRGGALFWIFDHRSINN
jgi:hypothetical protein